MVAIHIGIDCLWKICVFDSFGRSLNRAVKNT